MKKFGKITNVVSKVVVKSLVKLLHCWRCLKVTLQTCAPVHFCSHYWGAEQTVLHAQTQERGPPSAWAQILLFLL